MPATLLEIEKSYQKADTLEAKFEQNKKIESFGREKKSEGVVRFKRPSKFRWETFEPDPGVLVSDGRTFWHYTPPFDETDSGQLLIRKSTEVQSEFARALLSGRFSSLKGLKIADLSRGRFALTPAAGSAGNVIRALLEIDLKAKLIHRVTLEHEGGNKTDIFLSQIELGKTLSEEMFVFQAPERTRIVDESVSESSGKKTPAPKKMSH